jgi:hypothetical protein
MTFMRKNLHFIPFLILFILIIFSVCIYEYYTPRPIIELNEHSKIHFIRWNSEFGTDNPENMILLDDYDEEEILSYLSTCTEQLSLSKSNGYPLDDVALELLIDTGDGVKQILLGNINRSSHGYGSWLYQIQNSKEVLSTLEEMLHLPN